MTSRWSDTNPIGLTTTSPTSHCLPMPPAVPVVMMMLGRTSSMICCHTSSLGNVSPGRGAFFVSCERCESDLKTTTVLSPIFVVQ